MIKSFQKSMETIKRRIKRLLSIFYITDNLSAINLTLKNIEKELYFRNNSYSGELQAEFTRIYDTNMWGNGSGSGSSKKVCDSYIHFINNFIKEYNITSITDAGCGDWQSTRYFNLKNIQYDGYDVVESVIEGIKVFENNHIDFHLYDGDFSKLKPADLLICKDVLMHLSFANIDRFINELNKFRFALITNTMKENIDNVNISNGDYRVLDLRKAPFDINAELIFSFDIETDKKTLLWVNKDYGKTDLIA